jgi:hypothetical protein
MRFSFALISKSQFRCIDSCRGISPSCRALSCDGRVKGPFVPIETVKAVGWALKQE